MKKLISLTLVALFLSISMPIYGTELQTDTSLIYQEQGQIILDSVKLKNINGKVEVQDNSNPVQARALAIKLEEDPDVQQILTRYIEQGKTPVAIGWTKVYLKDSTDPNAVGQVEPMTVSDVQGSLENIITPNGIGTGPTTQKGALTLYTLAGYDNYNPSALFAESIATWGFELPGMNGPSFIDDDFITITWPSGHVLLSSYLNNGVEPYKHDEAYGSVVYGFGETSGTFTLSSNGRNDGSTGTRKWTSNYVHTWGNTVPSFSFGPGTISVNITNASYSWKIASSVLY